MALVLFLNFLLATGYAIAATSFGLTVVRLLGLHRAADRVGLATAFLLGLGVFGTTWLLLALAGRLSLQAVIGVLAIGGVSGLAQLGSRLAVRGSIAGTLAEFRAAGPPLYGIAALSALLVASLGVASLGPPIGDAVAFYMALAKLVAAGDTLLPLPGYDRFTEIGLHGELHFAALLTLAGEPAAKLLPWFVSIGAAGSLAGICRRCGLGLPGVCLGIAILFCSSAFTLVIADGKVDLFAAAFGLAAIDACLALDGTERRRRALLCGWLAGLATVAKLSYLAAFLPVVVVVVSAMPHGPGRRALWRQPAAWVTTGAVMAVGFLAAWLPHLVKNGLLFGQPLAPFVGAALQSRAQDLGASWLDQAWHTPEQVRRILLLYPVSVVFGRYPMQYGNLSPLALALVPLLALAAARQRIASPLKILTVAAIVGLSAFAVVRPAVFAPRYVLASLLLLIPIAARCGELAMARDGHRVLRGVVAGGVLLTLLSAWLGAEGSRVAAARAMAYQRGASPPESHQAVADRLSEAPDGSRVLFGAWYRYWLRDDLLQCAAREAELRTLADLSPTATWQQVHALGFHYVVLGPGFGYMDREGRPRTFGPETLPIAAAPAWLAVQEVHRDDASVAYRLQSTPEAPSPRFACARVGPAWRVSEQAGSEEGRGS